jgi:hypothetical protein
MTYRYCIAAIALIALTGCGTTTVKDTLGLSRSAPDEFRVVSRPPLSVPPEFTLRPPSNTENAPGQLSADKQAQSLVTGSDDAKPVVKAGKNVKQAVAAPSGTTGAESAFLKNAGADRADPMVRDHLTEERYSQQDKQENHSWWDIFGSSDTKKDATVNAQGEAQRIKKNEDEGKPVTTGDTPQVGGKDTGVLGRVFGY